jgi:hypothetical protein
MLKFTAESTDGNGRRLIGFGISAGNVARLTQGDPILIKLDEMGLWPADVLIFYGETEQALANAMKDRIGPDTKVSVDPRLDVKLRPG